MEHLNKGADLPSAVAAFALGFVGAQEAKETFIKEFGDCIPYVTLIGTRGGSAMAAAAMNAIAAWSNNKQLS